MKSTCPPTLVPDLRPCPICGTSGPTVTVMGFVVSPLCDPCRAADDEADRRQHIEGLLARAGAPPRMRGWSFDSFPQDADGADAAMHAGAWLRSYLDGGRSNLLLFGPPGTGKSGLAWSIVKAVCQQGRGALFLNFRDYLRDVRAAFGSNEPPDDRPHTARLLALDDLGAERPTDFARDELASLVEHRTGASLATIVTSNYPPKELAERLGHDDLVLGHRIVSRLVQDAVQVRVTGADRRLPD